MGKRGKWLPGVPAPAVLSPPAAARGGGGAGGSGGDAAPGRPRSHFPRLPMCPPWSRKLERLETPFAAAEPRGRRWPSRGSSMNGT